MLLYVYLGLVLFLLVFVIKNMVREKNLMLQIDAALVVVPLVLAAAADQMRGWTE